MQLDARLLLCYGVVGSNKYVHRFSTANPADFIGGGDTLCPSTDKTLATNVPTGLAKLTLSSR